MSVVTHGWASGKLILAGEHAVVHGFPALAFAVDLGTDVWIEPGAGRTTIEAPRVDGLLRRAIEQVVGPLGWTVRLRTALPVGRGMGSSASLAVALVRAWHRHQQILDGDVYEEALEVERHFHRNPSGVDVAVAQRGGVLRFRRGPPAELTPLPVPDWTAVVLDSGQPGPTAALVAKVASKRPRIDPILGRIGRLVERAEAVLDDAEALGPLLTENHRYLTEIGVSNDHLDALVDLSLASGAWGAKLSGAGGGGVVIALTADPDTLQAAATERGVPSWRCTPVKATT